MNTIEMIKEVTQLANNHKALKAEITGLLNSAENRTHMIAAIVSMMKEVPKAEMAEAKELSNQLDALIQTTSNIAPVAEPVIHDTFTETDAPLA